MSASATLLLEYSTQDDPGRELPGVQWLESGALTVMA